MTARLDLWMRRLSCFLFGHDIYVPTPPFQFRPLWCRRCARTRDLFGGGWR